MPFITRPAGDTDLSRAKLHKQGTLPQTLTGLPAGPTQVGYVEWSDPVTVTAPVKRGFVFAAGSDLRTRAIGGQTAVSTAGFTADRGDGVLTMLTAVNFVVPEPPVSSGDYLMYRSGSEPIRIDLNTTGRIRVYLGTLYHVSFTDLVPGDDVQLVVQCDSTGVVRDTVWRQINGGAPELVATGSSTDTTVTVDAARWYVGGGEGTSNKWRGEIKRVYHTFGFQNCLAFSEANFRKFFDADGGNAPLDEADTALGIEAFFDVVGPPSVIESGVVRGRLRRLNLNGRVFQAGAGTFARLTTESYSADAQADSTVARIVSDDDHTSIWSVVGDVDQRYKIVGRDIRLTGNVAEALGSHSLVLRQIHAGNVIKDRTFGMWVSPAGTDPLEGRLSIWLERDTVYTGEHTSIELQGLTDKEAALLTITSDVGDWGEVCTRLPGDHPNRQADGLDYGPMRVYVPLSGGGRTVTFRVYRQGQVEPVQTISRVLTVIDEASIPAADTRVVAKDGNFTGAPPNGGTFTSIDAAIQAITTLTTGQAVILYVKRGETWAGADLPDRNMGTTAGVLKRILIRPWGAGANPVLDRRGTQHVAWRWSGGDNSAYRLSLSVRGIHCIGAFDPVNIVTADDSPTYQYAATAFGGHGKMYLTAVDCESFGHAGFLSCGDNSHSLCVYNCKVDGWSTYGAIYSTHLDAGGIVGSVVRKEGNQPNVAKIVWDDTRVAGSTGPGGNGQIGSTSISINGPARLTDVRWFVIANSDMTANHAWSMGAGANDIITELGYEEPPMSASSSQRGMPYHQGVRFGSAQAVQGMKLQYSGNRQEGTFHTTSDKALTGGRLIYMRNHWTLHSGCSQAISLGHFGQWVVGNVFTIANARASRPDVSMVTVSTAGEATMSSDPDAYELGHKFVNNTFIDWRIPANMRNSDTGNTDKLVGATSVGAAESSGNVLIIPNRPPSGPAPNGWTVLSSLSGLSTTETKPRWYLGLTEVPYDQHNPYTPYAEPLADFATPTGTQIEARPAAGWSGVGAIDFGAPPSDDLVAHYGMEGHVTGTMRAIGAWATPA